MPWTAALPTVAVIGDSSLEPRDERLSIARECGAVVMELGFALVTGGRGGVMEAASAGARSSAAWSPGRIVAILPGPDPAAAHQHADVVLATGLGHARNALVAQCDAVIAIGGGAGTLAEIALAWCYDRLIIALRCPGWSGRLADTRIDGRERYPSIPSDSVRGAADAREAGELLKRWLREYTQRAGEVD